MLSAKTTDHDACGHHAPDARPGEGQLQGLVEALCDANGFVARSSTACPDRQPLPSRDTVVELVEALRTVLFPGYFGPSDLTADNLAYHLGGTLDRVQRDLREQIRRGFCFGCNELDAGGPKDCHTWADSVTRAFLSRLPKLRRILGTDVRAAYEGDPAATCPEEAIFCYPGLLAIMSHRLAHELHVLGVPLIPRMIAEHAHSVTGIDIHPGATIGESFFVDHGTGVVIGETCTIGKRVRLYQGVTLGAKSFPLDEQGNPIKGIKRHPDVEDDVIIYSGATILGPVTIGRGSVVGGNVWLPHSVPPESRVTQAQTRQDTYTDGAGI